MNWQAHWNNYPSKFKETDFFRQVGKTVKGVPISEDQVDFIFCNICNCLTLADTDVVLDLCCGNGLITGKISDYCKNIVGVDYSEPLIEIANLFHCKANVRYVYDSVLNILPMMFIDLERPFTKIYMYEALQHFHVEDLFQLIHLVRRVSTKQAIMFIGSIPDKDRIWNFYNSAKRRKEYYRRKAEGTESIGTWWNKKDVVEIAESEGCQCEILKQPKELYTAHYRFDVVLTL